MKNNNKLRQNDGAIKVLFRYIKDNKKWWLIPFFLILIFFGIFIIFAGNNSIMPLIYALF